MPMSRTACFQLFQISQSWITVFTCKSPFARESSPCHRSCAAGDVAGRLDSGRGLGDDGRGDSGACERCHGKSCFGLCGNSKRYHDFIKPDHPSCRTRAIRQAKEPAAGERGASTSHLSVGIIRPREQAEMTLSRSPPSADSVSSPGLSKLYPKAKHRPLHGPTDGR